MKKIIVNEQQIKKIIRSTINEQTENEKLIMAVQCFLNKTYNAKLVVDGALGEKTEKLLMKFQEKKGVYSDGIWGEKTYDSLTEPEKKLFKDCVAETGGVMDKIMNFLHLD
jgi:peptidoglycan hydrolase-like protein with peptidoglycan-binding domain